MFLNVSQALTITNCADTIRRELLGQRVFVFLRDGKILNLSRGATIIDAAFAIHTELGLKMTAAQINGHPRPLSYELHNGDVVSVIAEDSGRPALEWMRFARSRSTRAKLRQYFRSQQRLARVQKGWRLVHEFMRLNEELIQSRYNEIPNQSDLEKMIKKSGESSEDFLIELASASYPVVLASLSQLLALRYDEVEALEVQRRLFTQRRMNTPSQDEFAGSMRHSDIDSVLLSSSHACHRCMPVPGDDVRGLLRQDGSGFQVHLTTCPEVRSRLARGESSVPVEWVTSREKSEDYPVEVQVFCVDRKYLLRDISELFASKAEIVRTSSQTIDDKAMLQFKVCFYFS